jgi:hypothetical protein
MRLGVRERAAAGSEAVGAGRSAPPLGQAQKAAERLGAIDGALRIDGSLVEHARRLVCPQA